MKMSLSLLTKQFITGFIILVLSLANLLVSSAPAFAQTSPSIPSGNYCNSLLQPGSNWRLGENVQIMTVGQYNRVSYNRPVNLEYGLERAPLPNTLRINGLNENNGPQTQPTPSWLRLEQTGSTFSLSGTPPMSEAGKCYLLNLNWNSYRGADGNYIYFLYVAAPSTPPSIPSGPTSSQTPPTIPPENSCSSFLRPGGPGRFGENFQSMLAGQYSRVSYSRAVNLEYGPGRAPLPNTMRLAGVAQLYPQRTEYGQPVPPWIRLEQTGSTFSLSGTPPASEASYCYVLEVRWDTPYVRGDGNSTYVLYVDGGNKPPQVANPIPDRTVVEGQSITPINLSGTFTDPDGDNLSYTVYGLPSGLNFNPGNKTITGIPASGTAGTYSVTVKADDGYGHSVSQSFRITVQSGNRPPSYNNKSLPDLTAGTTTNLPIDLNNFFTDPDGDRLTFSNAVGLPNGLSLGANGQITGTPTAAAAAQAQPIAFSVDVSDGKNPTVTQRLTIKVNPQPNKPPAYNNKPLPDLTAGTTTNLPIDLNNFFTDPEGDRLTFSNAVGLPNGLSLAANGQITGTPTAAAAAQTQPIAFSVDVSDGNNPTVTQRLTIKVNPKPNSAPTRNPNFRLPNLTVGVPINPPIDVSNAFTDPDGDKLTYTIDIIDLPASLTFNPNTNQISGIPRRAGTLDIPITVSDNQNPPVTEEFSLTVAK
ncbi:MAG: putative Ig domain-containing protein [Actinomycetota bacterium]